MSLEERGPSYSGIVCHIDKLHFVGRTQAAVAVTVEYQLNTDSLYIYGDNIDRYLTFANNIIYLIIDCFGLADGQMLVEGYIHRNFGITLAC